MKRTLAVLATLLAVSLACEDPTGILGPLGFGVVEGREQEVSAVEAQLPEPVVARVWQDASGNAFLGIGPRPLFAQTGVKGVAGAVVCVGETPIEGDPIIPHARCTNTDAEGDATFHMSHPKKAGQHRTPIVAEVNGQALTPDTVTAIVEAGPASVHPFTDTLNISVTERVYGDDTVTDAYGNGVAWMFATDCACITVTGTLESWPVSRTLKPVAAGTGSLHILLSPTDTLASGTITIWEVPDDPGYFRGEVVFP